MSSSDAAMVVISMAYDTIVFLLAIGYIVLSIIAMWKMFEKAGVPGWACIVPVYGTYCLFDISLGNGWLFLLRFVPFVNVIINIIMKYKLAKAFGMGIGFGIGLILLKPIFMMILGFGSAEYQGVQ